MGMGGPNDHPISDLLYWGRNPFPPDVAEMIKTLHVLDSNMQNTFATEALSWSLGRDLDVGRVQLRAAISKHQRLNTIH